MISIIEAEPKLPDAYKKKEGVYQPDWENMKRGDFEWKLSKSSAITVLR